MKKYFLLSVHKKKQVLLKLIICIVVLCLSFGIRFILSNNSSEELFNTGLKEISIKNNHIFTENNKKRSKQFFFKNYPEQTKELFNDFLLRTDALMDNEEVEYGYYSVFCSSLVDSTWTSVIGASGGDFYQYNGIEIVDGRLPVKEDEGKHYAIAYQGKINSLTNEEIKVGDVITVQLYEDKEEFEVIGIYRVNYRYDYDVGTNDVFINNHLTIVSMQDVLERIQRQNHFDYESITINKIVLGTSNFYSYQSLKEIVNHYVEEFTSYCKTKTTITNSRGEIEYCDANIHTNSYEIDALLEATELTRKMYIVIGLVCAIAAVINYISLLSYTIENDKKEFEVLRSLGMSKTNIVKNYIYIVWYSTVVPFIIGILGSYYLQSFLAKRMKEMANSYYVELMTYGGLTIRQEFELTVRSNLFDWRVILITLLAIIIIETSVTVKQVLKCTVDNKRK